MFCIPQKNVPRHESSIGYELNTFRIKYKHLKVVIIDEISMVGNTTLSFIDSRLQQLTGTKAAFGGLSVIAVGDLYQLKPFSDF